MANYALVKSLDRSFVVPEDTDACGSEADNFSRYFMPEFADILTRINFICYKEHCRDSSIQLDRISELMHVLDKIYDFFEIRNKKNSSRFDNIQDNPFFEDIIEIRKNIPVLRHFIQEYNRARKNDFEEKNLIYKDKICPVIIQLGKHDYNFKQTFSKICEKEGKTIDDYLFRK